MNLAPWLSSAWQALAVRMERNELPHALLISGSAGVGKRALADALVTAALCQSRDVQGYACGHCRACQLMAAGTHPDRAHITFELRDDGKSRTEITVDQIRALAERLTLSSQFGGLQMVSIDPADALNTNAANALLKTLEEPSANTIIILVSDAPARLPATIRSRCQRINLNVPPRGQAQAWMQAQGALVARANTALQASLGNPGLALMWIKQNTDVLREECALDLAALMAGKVTAPALADRWAQDRPSERLWFTAVLIQEEAKAWANDQNSKPSLTSASEIPKLATWFNEANRARGLLSTTLRAELILLNFLWQMPAKALRRA